MEKKQKKLMLLGGLRYLIPVIEAAHRLGHYVITVDYVPGNVAHGYSDEYHNLSILDRDAVLSLARELQIDGIMSFAVDPGVVTAAYVAEKIGLPFQGSYESVSILQDKARFRAFLAANGFNVPAARGFTSRAEALASVNQFNWPVIVKPVDSAGSKGVSRVDSPAGLPAAVEYAMSESHSGTIIIEDFLEKEGCSSDSECFTVNGRLCFCSFSDQRFDARAENPYTPAAYSWPSEMPESAQSELTSELQRLMSLLGMRSGIYNVETRLCTDGKPYIMEVSPRGGGNRLAEMLGYAASAPLIESAVRFALGEESGAEQLEMPRYNGYLAEVILHADRDGEFAGLEISPDFSGHIVEEDLWVKQGDKVSSFTGANHAIGTLVVRFADRDSLTDALADISAWCRVRLR